jgi:CSLREA domain-containing protein
MAGLWLSIAQPREVQAAPSVPNASAALPVAQVTDSLNSGAVDLVPPDLVTPTIGSGGDASVPADPVALPPFGASQEVSVTAAPDVPENVIQVNTTTDTDSASDGWCSLREAIIAANTNTACHTCTAGSVSADTINFSGDFSISLNYITSTDLPAIMVSSIGHNGATRPIGLGVENAPAGLLWSLSRDTILPGGNATLIITATELLGSGVYPINLTGYDGIHSASTVITLTVTKSRPIQRWLARRWC